MGAGIAGQWVKPMNVAAGRGFNSNTEKEVISATDKPNNHRKWNLRITKTNHA